MITNTKPFDLVKLVCATICAWHLSDMILLFQHELHQLEADLSSVPNLCPAHLMSAQYKWQHINAFWISAADISGCASQNDAFQAFNSRVRAAIEEKARLQQAGHDAKRQLGKVQAHHKAMENQVSSNRQLRDSCIDALAKAQEKLASSSQVSIRGGHNHGFNDDTSHAAPQQQCSICCAFHPNACLPALPVI